MEIEENVKNILTWLSIILVLIGTILALAGFTQYNDFVKMVRILAVFPIGFIIFVMIVTFNTAMLTVGVVIGILGSLIYLSLQIMENSINNIKEVVIFISLELSLIGLIVIGVGFNGYTIQVKLMGIQTIIWYGTLFYFLFGLFDYTSVTIGIVLSFVGIGILLFFKIREQFFKTG